MRKTIQLLISMVLSAVLAGCNKYLDTPLPAGTISEENVYISDNSVSAVVTGNFLSLVKSSLSTGSLSNSTGLYVDELLDLNTGFPNPYYSNAIQAANAGQWTDAYANLYYVNSALEGIRGTAAQLYFKNQWLGETYFLRGVLYFHLTNLYGDVPLALTPDYAINNKLSRAPQSQVYNQIVSDLTQAKDLLNSGYTDGYGAATSHRVRPNRYAAMAMLGKVYLYLQKWDSASAMADSVIANAGVYSLEPVDKVFGTSSMETIWSLALPSNESKGYQYGYYNNGMPNPIVSPNTPGTYNVYASLNTDLVNTFEAGDLRLSNWVREVPVTGVTPAVTYYFPGKYTAPAASDENEIMLRLAEIYLIRAEARAHLTDIAGAQSDLNRVRTRAGLANTTATDATALLDAILRERRVELFTEGASRFFDLKRTGNIDPVMTAFAPTKIRVATWSHYMQLFPIPLNDLIQDPNLTPNPGYQH
ncbi:RagB/SusD family nutrient uptake outer membrane protein [Flavitalea sp. BT771]|uniref:RagB/SusD family nutrient uptake outer membrane protein n=1 Tax=Flavitalea sp. BT771 TaxID=3063329 RepID=UPI0026E3F3F6|nr:RagB/SusD family nutrient uptake outer membrane protein [Flavitalea sp. BT771]MDO6431817.1 RagB/SusD family nutrient uptake outer membrane protein [Flavitalea sp. BT771]MDV6220726.1 RagB/SusD family nutrient uptake outer membrane protein [Flavitalea sp. BT771]